MFLIGSLKKIRPSARTIFIIVAILIVSMITVVSAVVIATKEVVIDDNGQIVVVKTFKPTVGELLIEQDIHIEEDDDINPTLETKLDKSQKIKIKRAVPVNILVDGNELTINTCKNNIVEVLEQANIEINEKDEINYDLSEEVFSRMEINIVRVLEKIEDVQESIPFKTITRPNDKMDRGRNQIVQKGVEGIKQKTYSLVLHDGKEVSRNLINESLLTKQVDEIKEYGTVATYKPSRSSGFRYKQVIDMKATAYDLSYQSCGKHPGDKGYGITATGRKAQHGVVAVDPKVIPLNSRLYIEATDGSWTYGHAVAGDVGGGVNGNTIDLFYENTGQARAFGVKKAKVYILE